MKKSENKSPEIEFVQDCGGNPLEQDPQEAEMREYAALVRAAEAATEAVYAYENAHDTSGYLNTAIAVHDKLAKQLAEAKKLVDLLANQ